MQSFGCWSSRRSLVLSPAGQGQRSRLLGLTGIYLFSEGQFRRVLSSPRVSLQEQVSESATKTVLEKLLPDTRYSVTVVPVYAEGDGPSLSDVGKTSEYLWQRAGNDWQCDVWDLKFKAFIKLWKEPEPPWNQFDSYWKMDSHKGRKNQKQRARLHLAFTSVTGGPVTSGQLSVRPLWADLPSLLCIRKQRHS